MATAVLRLDQPEITAPGLFEFRIRHRHIICLLILIALLAFGTLVVYQTGGTAYAYPYLMLVPVLLASAWYRIPGAVITALAAALLMATIPLNVAASVMQEPSNWLIRLGLYLGLGVFSGSLFESLYRLNRKREMVLYTDSGTELPNTLALRKFLYKTLGQQKAQAPGIGVILIRITDITDVLEVMGVDASDELVTAFSTRLIKTVPPSASVYRFSNAELMVVLPRSDLIHMRQVIPKLTDASEINLTVRNISLRTQVVMGSSLSSRHPDVNSLISEARMSLFAAIDKHRSHFHYSPAIQRRTLRTIQLIANVRQGLERGEFELHFQPKIQLSNGSVCGCEGLIRWCNGEGGFIPPGSFMPKVENTTLISPVTRFVVKEAFRFAESQSGTVSVNFSVRNLFDPDLISVLQELLVQTKLAPHQLEVEITESALLHDLHEAKRAIERIRSFGIGVSIDDFGTGFASFAYLQHLPLTGLKIDRAFIPDIEHNARTRKLVSCMIDVGHALDMVVTAEGVETRGQHDVLRSLGCDQAQGFLYSPALPPEHYSRWLENYIAR
ncbi:GGDEF domain-containing phosphodiesterase [Marinobacter sp. 71-i]|uniref:GGDEF domain-containing phosphodiesterase n=1 Tax=Marinobacter iranensis TaxID=2962607 RepID=A0ABT5YEH6_9GAMM|nr:GGDEF domain-containing phosphodiesterase [Marinobacter iranensis]MDF0751435.1 GGDEF domain-containing phosphodiesterase [Marinobacter iranensis]